MFSLASVSVMPALLPACSAFNVLLLLRLAMAMRTSSPVISSTGKFFSTTFGKAMLWETTDSATESSGLFDWLERRLQCALAAL